jgi:hypothetical protein
MSEDAEVEHTPRATPHNLDDMAHDHEKDLCIY